MSLLDQGIALVLEEVNRRCRNPIADLPVVERRNVCVALKFKKHYVAVHAESGSDPPRLVYYFRQNKQDVLHTLEDITNDGYSHYGYEDVDEMVAEMLEDQ